MDQPYQTNPPNYQPAPQPTQPPAQYVVMSPETEKLLRRYLKMQIGRMYFGVFSWLIILVVTVLGFYLSVKALVPFVESQMGNLMSLQSSLGELKDLTSLGTGSQPMPTTNNSGQNNPSSQGLQGQTSNPSTSDIMNSLSPEEKSQLQELLKK